MTRAILNNGNLVKKYHNNLVFDYTEYPTKSNWDLEISGADYKQVLADWLPKVSNEPVVFYVHTPYCEELCYFCLCSKEITRDYTKVTNYLDNYLYREIDLLEQCFESAESYPNVETIYFGGGSPTYYKPKEFESLVAKLGSIINFNKVKNFTVEIDPRRIDLDRLHFYHRKGVNRLSFGIQDFDPLVQKEINRIQPPELVENLLTPEIRKLFPTVAFDLLIGLPKQTPESIATTIDRVIQIGPDEIQTMYVHYKPDTRKYMTRMVRNEPMLDFYDRKAVFLEASERLMDAGYVRAGFESFVRSDSRLAGVMEKKSAIYNSIGTQSDQLRNFLAVGSSAHGALGEDYYFQNYYEQRPYRLALDSGQLPVYRGLKLSKDDILRRNLICDIRTYFGFGKTRYETKYGIEFDQYFQEEYRNLEEFEKDGIVRCTRGGLELTELGIHFAPQVASVFDKYLKRDLYNKQVPV